MTIVTNETELRNAIMSGETEIQIANGFEMMASIAINRTVSISSTPNNIFTLLKNSSFLGVVFSVQNNATLTLTNIILDGNKENHDFTNPGNDSLIVVSAGTLILGENSIL